MSLTARIVIGRRLGFLPPRLYAIGLHLLFQEELSTLRRPRGYAQMAAAKNLGQQPPLVPRTADKYAVRSYVADTVGEQYLIPLIQVVSHADDLDMGALTDPCVIKGTHGCNMTILLPEGAPRNERAIRATVAALARHRLLPDGLARGALPRAAAPRAVVERFIGEGERAAVGLQVLRVQREGRHGRRRPGPLLRAHLDDPAPGLARVRGRRRQVRRGRRAAPAAAELRRDAGGGASGWPPTSRSPASTSTTSTAASTSARSPTTPAAASSGCGRARSTGRWASCGATARRSPSSSAAPAQPSGR